MEKGVCGATVHGVTKSWTGLSTLALTLSKLIDTKGFDIFTVRCMLHVNMKSENKYDFRDLLLISGSCLQPMLILHS